MKRPMRTVSLEPNFSRKSTRAFVCGGLAGNLVLHEKGWLGHKETVLHAGEGPIWQARWRGRLIVWANDLGVKLYDTTSQTRIAYINRQPDSPRADLFKCTIHWQDDSTFLIAWANHIKVARVRTRPNAPAGLPSLMVEITAFFQVDCMISGILPHPLPPQLSIPATDPILSQVPEHVHTLEVPSPTALLVLAYIPPPTDFSQEFTSDPSQQRRQAADLPELRIISRAGEEVSADVLRINGYERWSCGDYVLCDTAEDASVEEKKYFVMSPKDVISIRPRDAKDHVAWLVERRRYEEALQAVEHMGESGIFIEGEDGFVDAKEIGRRYIEHLISEGALSTYHRSLLDDMGFAGDFRKAARLCPNVCGQDAKSWEDWIFMFAEQKQLQVRRDLGFFVPVGPKFTGYYSVCADRVATAWPLSIRDDTCVFSGA